MNNPIAIVTGGAGFIGSHMVDLLLSEGYEVRVLDNFSGGHERNLEQHAQNPLLHVHKVDICQLASRDNLFKGAKYIFHFAGIGDIVPSIEKPADYMNTNVQGTVRVLEAARTAGSLVTGRLPQAKCAFLSSLGTSSGLSDGRNPDGRRRPGE